ncbi:hypothetical protein PAHAL_7G180000 [Panicum hallii]|jgi:hypothetical protein|uniref:GTD-binding domain-containing protein n=1 Tax=Panicum hallii TaxID=206008 RepID=A0A2S3I7I4_9POAL|nr:protein FLOURY 1-like [Panicum hallii]PAN38552.1 hypothetical protein PAHAL_7G180000 [Panicum hallii]
MGRKKNGGSGAGFLKPLGGVSPARMSGAGAVFFLVGSALGFVAVLHASESEEAGGEWASAARWAARSAARWATELAGSVGAHHLLVAVSLLFLAASVWRLGKRCAAVEGLVGSTDSAVQALRVGGIVCAVCGSKIQALKRGRRSAERTRSDASSGCPDKPVSRSLAAEFEQEADKDEEDNAGETSDSEEGNVQYLRRRLKEERLLKEVALEELEKERLAAASAADEAMAKIACLRSEKALVEREARQLQEMAQQKQMYDRQVIESLQWVIMKSGMQGWEPEAASDPAVSETSEDDRDRK